MRRPAGFTLLELLVALSIFAVVSVMAYGGMSRVMDQRARTAEQADRLKYLQLAVNVMARDFEQLVDRGIRNEFGDPQPALIGGSGFQGIEFTHAGYANPARLPRSELQRVAYVREEDRILRRAWRVLDRAQDSRPATQVLMEEVDDFRLRFLDAAGAWQDNWPAPGQAGDEPPGVPRAVEVSVETGAFGRLRWLFRLPATPQPEAAAPAGGQQPPPGTGGAT